MQHRVDLDGVALHQLAGGLVVALALDALNLGQQRGNELSQSGIVADAYKRLSLTLEQRHHIALSGTPMGDEGAVAHVSLFYLVARRDANELRHQTVHHVRVVLCLVSLAVGQQSQFHKLRVGHVVESEEVGSCLLDGVAVSLQRVGIDTRQQLSATVSETLMKVGMKVVARITITLYQRECFLVNDKLFLETASVGSFVVSIGNIRDGYALRTVAGTNPVGVGQIDADSRRRILLAAQHGSTDNVGRDTLDYRFAEARVNGRVVLEPLGILGDGARAVGSLFVDVLYESLPRAFQSEGVAIDLDESVDEVHPTLQALQPQDAVFVEQVQVTRFVVLNECLNNLALAVVLGYAGSLLQPIDDMAYGSAIAAVGLPNILIEFAVALHECRVQSVGWRLFFVVGFLGGIELLGLLLRHAVIEVAGRRQHQVLAVSFVHALGQHRGVEDDGLQLLQQFVDGLSFCQRQAAGVNLTKHTTQVVGREVRHEFLAAIVMVDAVGEPKAFQVDFQCAEAVGIVVDGQISINDLQHLADAEVILSILVEGDVAAVECGL